MINDHDANNATSLPVILCDHIPPGMSFIVPVDYVCEACLDDVVTEAWAIINGA